MSLRVSANLFDNLTDVRAEQDAGNRADMRVRTHALPGVIHRGFAYSTAIGYPFQADRLTQSRYPDGSFPVWYGALNEAASIRESAWHALQQVRRNPDVRETVHRERAVWNVRARGVFIDFRGKLAEAPALVAASCASTQAIGKRLAALHPDLVAPSARRRGGARLAAFVEDVLSDPRLSHYLTYQIDPVAGTVRVERSRDRPSRLRREDDLQA